MVELFKESNPKWNSIRIVVIDKDFTEWKVLQDEFPDATILYSVNGMLLKLSAEKFVI